MPARGPMTVFFGFWRKGLESADAVVSFVSWTELVVRSGRSFYLTNNELVLHMKDTTLLPVEREKWLGGHQNIWLSVLGSDYHWPRNRP